MAQFNFAGNQALSGGAVRYTFTGADVNAVEAAVFGYFTRRGYNLEEGTPDNGVYGKGNAALRVVIGGLVTRFKFRVAIGPGQGATLLDFGMGMRGWAGGTLGASNMTKEFKTIRAELKAL